MNAMNGKQKAVKALAALAMAAGLQGCESGGPLAGLRESDSMAIVSGSIIRQRSDPARGRLWVLTKEGLDVYESSQRRRIARIEIPGWQWVHERYACAPDFALGPKGEVVVTSNVMATLWRVDPASLAITRHEIAVEPRTGREFGFTGLTYSSSRGAYYGVGAVDGAVWRIDPQLRVAREPAPGVASARVCGVA